MDRTGHVSLATNPADIERTLRSKLRERSEGRSCHELHRVWQQYDKDFDHRVDINEFKQIMVAFNIHPADSMLRAMFKRYDANDDGLVERAEFENAVLNGILPRGPDPPPGHNKTPGGKMERNDMMDATLHDETKELENHARVTMGLLAQAREANQRVMALSGGAGSRRSTRRSRSAMSFSRTLSGRPQTVPTGRGSRGSARGLALTGTDALRPMGISKLDLSKAEGL